MSALTCWNRDANDCEQVWTCYLFRYVPYARCEKGGEGKSQVLLLPRICSWPCCVCVCVWGPKFCCSASCFSQGYHLWASVMTGLQRTPRVCPSDTQKLGFSYTCSSSLSCLLFLFLSLSVYLPSSLYLQRLHLQSCVCIWMVSTSDRGGKVRSVMVYTERSQSAQISKACAVKLSCSSLPQCWWLTSWKGWVSLCTLWSSLQQFKQLPC